MIIMKHDRAGLVATSIAVLVLLLSSSFANQRASAAASSSQVIPGITETQPWLQQQLVQWAPSSIYKMDFGAPVMSIGYANVYSTTSTPEVVDSDISMLEQTGMQMVRIDLGYDAWLANDAGTIQSFGNYIQMINASGKLLVIADAAAERYRSYPLSWTNYQIQWVERVKELASLYHPYAYIVVKEPGWYYPEISDSSTNSAVYDANSWGNLTSALATAVKSVSPNTKVGVSVAAFDLYNDSAYQGRVSFNVQFLQHVEKIPNVDFIAFDIYDIAGFLGTQHFLSQYGNGGKGVWIAEAWSGDQINLSDATRAPLDVLWIQVLYYFALMIHAEAVLPFYSDLFASYETPPTTASGMLQFYQQRTPVFSEFQKVISSNAALQPLNSTSSTSAGSSSSTSSTSTVGSSSSSSLSSHVSSASSGSSASSSSSASSTPSSASTVGSSATSFVTETANQSRSPAPLVGLLVLVGILLVVGGVLYSRRGRR
jgi:hypothetical protein